MRRTVGLMVAAALVAAPAQAQLGSLTLPGVGDVVKKAKTVKKVHDALQSFPEPREIQLGRKLAAIVLGAAPLVDDPAKQRYVARLGTWLAQHSERPGLPWRFAIVRSDDFNAFSTPGGVVLINSGLFERMRSESELAGVLSHEIAHVVAKHHLKALRKQLDQAAISDLAQYGPSGPGGVTGTLTSALVAAGRNLYVRGLDKKDEYEADRMAVVIAVRSGYSPYGFVGALQTLAAIPVKQRTDLIYRTHPSPEDRLSKLDGAMGTRLDGIAGLVDDLPSFVALRNPAPPSPPVVKPAAAKPAKAPPRKKKRK